MNTASLLPSMETFLDAVYDDVRRARERVMVRARRQARARARRPARGRGGARLLYGHGSYVVAVRLTGPIVDDVARHFEQRWAERTGAPPRDFDTGDRHPDVRLVSDSPSREPRVQCAPRPAPRGVDVRIIVPGASDLAVIARSTRAEYRDWLVAV